MIERDVVNAVMLSVGAPGMDNVVAFGHANTTFSTKHPFCGKQEKQTSLDVPVSSLIAKK